MNKIDKAVLALRSNSTVPAAAAENIIAAALQDSDKALQRSARSLLLAYCASPIPTPRLIINTADGEWLDEV